MNDCIFCKIVNKEIPKEFAYEDADVVVFADINPVRKVHLLIIPKEHITEVMTVKEPELFQKLFTVAQKMIREQNLEDKGYRLSMNGGGAQVIDHFHIHLMGPMTKTATLG